MLGFVFEAVTSIDMQPKKTNYDDVFDVLICPLTSMFILGELNISSSSSSCSQDQRPCVFFGVQCLFWNRRTKRSSRRLATRSMSRENC